MVKKMVKRNKLVLVVLSSASLVPETSSYACHGRHTPV
eukprot:XP_001708862.1 Hypothetical protein GL50803_9120 [Giardia lamblia ATCC 50803]